MQELEAILGYNFKDSSLLEEALTHPSSTQKSGPPNYERLELLGDAVLGLVITELLMKAYKDEREGALAKRRAGLVCGPSLARVALDMGLGKFLKLGEGERQAGGDMLETNLENALEAVIGAIYTDGGLEPARQFIISQFAEKAANVESPPKDAKTVLQEWSQSKGKGLPVYNVVSSEGPAHAPEFIIEVAVEGKPPATGTGASKRLAEQEAAKALLQTIGRVDKEQ